MTNGGRVAVSVLAALALFGGIVAMVPLRSADQPAAPAAPATGGEATPGTRPATAPDDLAAGATGSTVGADAVATAPLMEPPGEAQVARAAPGALGTGAEDAADPDGAPASGKADEAGTPSPRGATGSTAADALAFDIVRLEPDGGGLVAGRAAPGAIVRVLTDGAVAAEAVAGPDGRFVAFLDLPPSPAPRALSLESGDATSDATVLLAPTVPDPDAGTIATANPDAALAPGRGEDAAGTDLAAGGSASTTGAAPDPGAPPELVASAEELRAPAASQTADAAAPSEIEPTIAPGTATTASSDAAAAVPASPTDERADLAAAPDRPSASDAATGGSGADEPAIARAGPDAATAGAAPAEGSAPPARPAQAPVLSADADGVQVIQPALPPDADAELLSSIALDAIAYDGGGDVTLSGRAPGGAPDEGATADVSAGQGEPRVSESLAGPRPPGATVRLYLDNAPVASTAIEPDGQWRAPLGDAPPGVYTLRVDELDAEGRVLSRIETPFQREARADVAALVTPAEGARVAVRTVQPGNTLWAIARDRYDEPLLYVRVFEANRDRIRDPDLIYPGQVFVLPELEAP